MTNELRLKPRSATGGKRGGTGVKTGEATEGKGGEKGDEKSERSSTLLKEGAK